MPLYNTKKISIRKLCNAGFDCFDWLLKKFQPIRALKTNIAKSYVWLDRLRKFPTDNFANFAFLRLIFTSLTKMEPGWDGAVVKWLWEETHFPKVVGSKSALDTQCTFLHIYCCKNCNVCLKKTKINEKEAGEGQFLKMYPGPYSCVNLHLIYPNLAKLFATSFDGNYIQTSLKRFW